MTVVCDTSALLALLDRSETTHAAVTRLFRSAPESWIIPAAVLPETDYLLSRHVGAAAARLFLEDVAAERFTVEWGRADDLLQAAQIIGRYRGLPLGYVDAMVMAAAVRLRADAIATLDLRHFGAVKLATKPRLLPRDA
ncbi:MAG: type II toxin-antitoxin system VapC family toxin [Terriglobales bacterium]